MAIMITGGTGFLGSHLSRYLLEEAGESELVIFEQSPNLARISDIQDRLTIVQGDVLEPMELLSAMQRHNVDRVVHLAFILGIGSTAVPGRAVKINCIGTSNVFEAARLHGVKRVVYASSVAVYGHRATLDGEEMDEEMIPRPTGLYGACKLFNEHLAELYWGQYGLDVIGLRPISVFGEGRGQRITSDPQHFMVRPEMAALGHPITMPPDEQVADWIYAPDAAEAWHSALTVKEPLHRVFNMSAERRTIGEATSFLRKILPDVSIKVDTKPTDGLILVSGSRLRAELDFKPKYTLEEGLLHYVNGVRVKAGLAPVSSPD